MIPVYSNVAALPLAASFLSVDSLEIPVDNDMNPEEFDRPQTEV